MAVFPGQPQGELGARLHDRLLRAVDAVQDVGADAGVHEVLRVAHLGAQLVASRPRRSRGSVEALPPVLVAVSHVKLLE